MNPYLTSFLGIIMIFAATTLGSCIVFLIKGQINEKFNCLLLGISSGVMVAASFFGLILPCLESSASYGKLSFVPAVVGIIGGGLLLQLLDFALPHIHKSAKANQKGGLSKSARLLLSVTLHNIPEGLAVGVAFGCALASASGGALVSALGLAIGIAIQNFPEGAAVSLPIKASTANSWKGFWAGTISGSVEPVFAVIGLLAAKYLTGLMPWALAFSAGAMLFVTVGDLVPDSKYKTGNLGVWGFMAGFVVMMILDICL